MKMLGSDNVDFFTLDTLARVRSSDLDKCLLMVPYGYVIDILKAIVVCLQRRYRVELCTRVCVFLLRLNIFLQYFCIILFPVYSVHQSQLTSASDALVIVDKLRKILPERIEQIRVGVMKEMCSSISKPSYTGHDWF
jgi:hypothetical protein